MKIHGSILILYSISVVNRRLGDVGRVFLQCLFCPFLRPAHNVAVWTKASLYSLWKKGCISFGLGAAACMRVICNRSERRTNELCLFGRIVWNKCVCMDFVWASDSSSYVNVMSVYDVCSMCMCVCDHTHKSVWCLCLILPACYGQENWTLSLSCMCVLICGGRFHVFSYMCILCLKLFQ